MSDLLEFIKANDVIQHGSFRLASGKESNIYVNCKKITLDAVGLNLAIPPLYDKLRSVADFDAVGGLTMGADPIVGAMLQHASTKLKGFLVRKEPKEHGTKQLIEGPVVPGMRVAIVEDVATTGMSAAKAMAAAADFGLTVVAVGSIINRKEGADELFASLGVPFVYLLDVKQFSE